MENGLNGFQRVCVLIDNQNIKITGDEIGKKIVYCKVIKKLNNRPIIRCILYHIISDDGRDQGFIRKIRSMGIEVKTKKKKTYDDGAQKGDFDVEIAVDAIALSEKCDVIVIVSCDSDLVHVLRYLKAKGIKTEILAYPHCLSPTLRQEADEFIPITDDMLLPKNDSACLKVSIKDHLMEKGKFDETKMQAQL
jgi:uncharacterized LabA/DUF88 family protein